MRRAHCRVFAVHGPQVASRRRTGLGRGSTGATRAGRPELRKLAAAQVDLDRKRADLSRARAQVPTGSAQVELGVDQTAILTGREQGSLPVYEARAHIRHPIKSANSSWRPARSSATFMPNSLKSIYASAIRDLCLNWRRGKDGSSLRSSSFASLRTVGADADVLAAAARRTPLFIFSGSNPRFVALDSSRSAPKIIDRPVGGEGGIRTLERSYPLRP